MKSKAKKLFDEKGVLSVSFLQNKLQINAETAEQVLLGLCLKKTDKVYENNRLVRIFK